MTRLFLVDDDQALCDLLQEYLQGEGFDVTVRHDGGTGLEVLREVAEGKRSGFDVIVLDVMLPVHNGFDLLRRLRECCQTPVLMLTARGDTVDRIVGLEMGADDYLPKPCNPRELVARLRAILRRTETPEPPARPENLSVDGLKMVFANRTVTYKGSALTLTGAEFTVLELLMLQAGDVISKEDLTEKALNRKLTPYDRSIDVHVSNLRKKLSGAGAGKDLIINIRGAGYMLTREQ
jgi:DNA-binding response OmpR family regulator